jgi:hypothetical protein
LDEKKERDKKVIGKIKKGNNNISLKDLNTELYEELSKQKPIRMLIQGGKNVGINSD